MVFQQIKATMATSNMPYNMHKCYLQILLEVAIIMYIPGGPKKSTQVLFGSTCQ